MAGGYQYRTPGRAMMTDVQTIPGWRKYGDSYLARPCAERLHVARRPDPRRAGAAVHPACLGNAAAPISYLHGRLVLIGLVCVRGAQQPIGGD